MVDLSTPIPRRLFSFRLTLWRNRAGVKVAGGRELAERKWYSFMEWTDNIHTISSLIHLSNLHTFMGYLSYPQQYLFSVLKIPMRLKGLGLEKEKQKRKVNHCIENYRYLILTYSDLYFKIKADWYLFGRFIAYYKKKEDCIVPSFRVRKDILFENYYLNS